MLTALSPRKVAGWYAAFCVAVMLVLGRASLFFAVGILLLPLIGLALFSWRVQEGDSFIHPGFTPALDDMHEEPVQAAGEASEADEAGNADEAGKRNELFSRAAALLLWAVISCVTLAYNFSLVSQASASVSREVTGEGAGTSSGTATPVTSSSVLAIVILIGTAAISIFLLTPAGRKVAARFIPIDPGVFRHGVGLSLVTLLALSSATPLLVHGSEAPEASTVYLPADSAQLGGAQTASMVYELLWFVPLAFVAAGWPRFRTLRAASARLGLGGFTLRKATLGAVAGLIMTCAAAFLLEPAVRWLWDTAGWSHSNATLTARLFSSATNPWGALMVSLTAGIGEELLVRGLLQPRFGLIASNLAFVAMHAYGYGWDGLVSVTVLGLALGALRGRTDTATAMLAHGVYDLVTLVGISFLP